MFRFPKFPALSRTIMSLSGVILLLLANSTWATYSRVESMGKRPDFFMDDVSIFENPANMNIFPNFLIGEMGTYSQDSAQDAKNGDKPMNMDPANSWFGGIFSYSLGKNRENPSLYPQISLGGAFNRKDTELFALIPDSADGHLVPQPATNFDGFLGMTLGNGGMLGSHIYIANQEGADLGDGRKSVTPDAGMRVTVAKFDLGANWPVARNIDAELSGGVAMIGFGPQSIEDKFSYFVKARAFSTLEIINGELVPIFSYSHLEAPGLEGQHFRLGIGANVSLDRGFFWLGVQGLLDHVKSDWFESEGKTVYRSDRAGLGSESMLSGALIGFGIERNVWWDWLVLRVGGQKVIGYMETDGPLAGDKYGYYYSNPTGDMSPNDHVGFGIGLNIEEKLKIDATLAEDILYTFGSLLSRPQHHMISRISATYSF